MKKPKTQGTHELEGTMVKETEQEASNSGKRTGLTTTIGEKLVSYRDACIGIHGASTHCSSSDWEVQDEAELNGTAMPLRSRFPEQSYGSNSQDVRRAFEGASWMILDHYLMLRKWHPQFFPGQDEFKRVAVWGRGAFLTEMAKFARMFVEVDLRNVLIASFQLKKRVYKVEYEGLHLIYFHCGRYGHRKDTCPPLLQPANATEIHQKQPGNMAEKDGIFFNTNTQLLSCGRWTLMHVLRI
ncbi:hypothetical protein VNO78_04161 [Psophocarpus tetragonolobus]|uniref:CCHC-type domain-containing protein n=1 Tax=Psophocarpus tetragonolobus TaxID=3891 RepID=A0AAN9T5I5_PSOTE